MAFSMRLPAALAVAARAKDRRERLTYRRGRGRCCDLAMIALPFLVSPAANASAYLRYLRMIPITGWP